MENFATRVLIAEDLKTSRMVLERMLQKWGYEVIGCENGLEAQEVLARPDGPRIAILDWVMPGLTGPELCKWITRDLGSFVYTILLTGKDKQDDLIEGLTAGAHAYIKKPAQPDELATYIRVAERVIGYEHEIAEKNRELTRYATQMEALAEERARQLVHADRMVTLGVMSAGIAHEINNSTTMLSGNVQTLERIWPVVREALANASASTANDDQLAFILEEVPNILSGMRSGVSRVTKIVKGLKTFAHRDEHADMEPCQLNDSILASVDLCENALKRTASVELKLDATLPVTMATRHQMEQVFVNMIVNACDAIRPTAPGTITITSRFVGDRIIIVFEDTGPGIPEEIMAKIWDPFYTTKGVGKGTGLGLSISLGIIESHSGTYTVENKTQGGARFTISLPLRRPPG
jgi:two-component system NtrC family sensor kinase